MKKLLILILISFLFSCNMQTVNKDELVQKFNSLSTSDKIDFFNTLDNKERFLIIEEYLNDKCFEIPVENVIKFKSNGGVVVDWMIRPDGYGLVYASGKEEPFVKYIPFQWEIKNQSLVIIKNEQYSEYNIKKGEDDLIFNFKGDNKIIFDEVFFSLFQNKIEITLKNKGQQIYLQECSCELWPVMIEDLYE